MYREEYDVRSVWVAAYLNLFGVELLRVVPTDTHRSNFVFKNDQNRAQELADEWRTEHDAEVNGPEYMRSYHNMLRRAHEAEDEQSGYVRPRATANGYHHDRYDTFAGQW